MYVVITYNNYINETEIQKLITTLYTINPVNEAHLVEVLAYMKQHGSPTIRVVDCGDYYQALEGSHRTAGASILGLPINFDILEQDDNINSSTLDLDGLAYDEEYTAGEIAAEIYHSGMGVYTINNDNTVICQFEAR